MLRPYQKKLIDIGRQKITKNRQARICFSCPTGGGKSFLISYLAEQFMMRGKRVLVIAHRKKLLEQNREKFKGKASFYCAGLDEKCLNAPVVFGSIQTLANAELPQFDAVLIDECHRVPLNLDSQYRKLITHQKDAFVFGFTATPFRLRKGGNVSIIKNKKNDKDPRFFDTLVQGDDILSLVSQGYLCPMKTKVDMSISHKEFNKDFKLDFDLKQAGEILQTKSKGYIDEIKKAFISVPPHRAIIFCCDIAHVNATAKSLSDFTSVGILTSKEDNNDRTLERFKSGAIKVLINCEMLTEGYDLPSIDYVILLRPTDSTALFVQMVGRGLRIALNKKFCTVLDFGGNIEKHGALNDIRLDEWSGNVITPDKTRICPKCFYLTEDNPCIECGYQFEFEGFDRKPPEEKLKKKASTSAILAQSKTTYTIDRLEMHVHKKRGSTGTLRTDRTLRIDFYDVNNITVHKEYLALNHTGFARGLAIEKWRTYSNDAPPVSVEQALDFQDNFKKIKNITVFTKRNGLEKYPKKNISNLEYGEGSTSVKPKKIGSNSPKTKEISFNEVPESLKKQVKAVYELFPNSTLHKET